MTTARIDTFQDLLNLLDEKPAWVTELRVRLLTPDLIALPEEFARFAAETNRRLDALAGLPEEFARFAAETNRRLDALEGLPAQVEDLKAQFARFAAETNRRLDALEGLPAQFEDLKAQFAQFAAETNRRLDALEGLPAQVEEFKTRTEADIQELKTGQSRIWGEINNLRGDKYERRITRYIALTARINFNMRRVRVLLGEFTLDNNELVDLMDDIDDNGRAVTAEQMQDLGRTDIIIAGVNRADGAPLYAVIEVAVTLNRDDISRAQRRAGVLAAATGQSVLPAVIGSAIDEIDRRRADAAGVGLVIIHE